MTISSRTPEGQPNECPICGNALRIEPSRPPGDAPCPFCGSLLWFQLSCHSFRPRDRVRVKAGAFAAMEGTVEAVTDPRAENPDFERILNECRDQVETTF